MRGLRAAADRLSPHLGVVPRASGRAGLVCAGLLRRKNISILFLSRAAQVARLLRAWRGFSLTFIAAGVARPATDS